MYVCVCVSVYMCVCVYDRYELSESDWLTDKY